MLQDLYKSLLEKRKDDSAYVFDENKIILKDGQMALLCVFDFENKTVKASSIAGECVCFSAVLTEEEAIRILKNIL
jgi:hypothetical protein